MHSKTKLVLINTVPFRNLKNLPALDIGNSFWRLYFINFPSHVLILKFNDFYHSVWHDNECINICHITCMYAEKLMLTSDSEPTTVNYIS